MGEDEKRAIKMAALLDFEEARADLALLRAKAEQWYRLHERVTHLLARAKRDSAHLEVAAKEARSVVMRELTALGEVMNIDAVLALDAELELAVERMKKAEATKKALGFV